MYSNNAQPNKEIEQKEKLIACPECDLLMVTDELIYEQQINCKRCGSLLNIYRKNMVSYSLSLALTALILFIPASFLTILKIDILGHSQEASVWDSVLGLYNSGMITISALVLMCGLAIPLIKLLCQLYALLAIHFNKSKHLAIFCYKLYQELKEWGMLEIYLLGILVSIVKLHGMAELHIGMGLACFIMLLFVQVWLEVIMSPLQTWTLLGKINDHHTCDR